MLLGFPIQLLMCTLRRCTFLLALANEPNGTGPVVIGAAVKELVIKACPLGSTECGTRRLLQAWPWLWHSALLGALQGPTHPSWALSVYLAWPELSLVAVVLCLLWAYRYPAAVRARAAKQADKSLAASSSIIPVAGVAYSSVLLLLRGIGSLVNTLNSASGPALSVQLLSDGKLASALLLPSLTMALEKVRPWIWSSACD